MELFNFQKVAILHCLSRDYERMIYPFQGRDSRLPDVHETVVKDVLG